MLQARPLPLAALPLPLPLHRQLVLPLVWRVLDSLVLLVSSLLLSSKYNCRYSATSLALLSMSSQSVGSGDVRTFSRRVFVVVQLRGSEP